jgi:prepilin-type N-terminal cleavage/methylation domain-containing protein
MPRRDHQAGFTLIELVISMVLLALISLSIFGLATIGARAAGSGERRTEQARRLRIATTLMARQLRSAAPLHAVIESEEENEALPYFLGESDRLDFITTQPQRPDSGGYALVSYWIEDDVVMMSEMPYFMAFSENRLGREYDHMITSTALLYDVGRLSFSYQRFDPEIDGDWEDSWDASLDDALPAVVRVEIEARVAGGAEWSHDVPVFVGVMNEMMMVEDDFSRRPGRGPTGATKNEEEEEEEEEEPEAPAGRGDDENEDLDDEEEDE